jgi:hypothetical protein
MHYYCFAVCTDFQQTLCICAASQPGVRVPPPTTAAPPLPPAAPAPRDMFPSRLKAARCRSHQAALRLSLMSSYAHASARPPSDDAASARCRRRQAAAYRRPLRCAAAPALASEPLDAYCFAVLEAAAVCLTSRVCWPQEHALEALQQQVDMQRLVMFNSLRARVCPHYARGHMGAYIY